MLLKFEDGVGGWHCFDKVDSYHYSNKIRLVRRREDLPTGVVNLIASECFPKGGNPLREGLETAEITFKRQGSEIWAVFTSQLFVCTDSGDTVDKINLKRRQGR